MISSSYLETLPPPSDKFLLPPLFLCTFMIHFNTVFFKKLRKILKLLRKTMKLLRKSIIINEKRLMRKKRGLRGGGNPNTICKTAIHICIQIVRRMI
jgi:hypothetical protein